MKTIKKVVALLLASAFVLSMAACHPKDEIALWSGDYKITSAMYSYYLIMADAEAKDIINSSEDYDTSKSNFNYYKQKIDGKTYEEYVKDLAIQKCLSNIALEKLCSEAKISLDKEDKEGWQSTAQYYWSYSYGELLSKNGVSYNTYEKLMLNDALYNLYFNHLYGEKGEKEVEKEDIKEALGKNYSAVYLITHDYSEEKEPDVDAIEKNLEKYVTSLKDGKDFETVLGQYNKDNNVKTEDEKVETENTDDKKDESDKTDQTKKPVDENIVILTDYEKTYSGETQLFSEYEKVEKLQKGEVALIHDEKAKCYYIVVKKDIYADSYYLDNLSEELLYLLKSEEYDEFLDKTVEKIDYEVNKYAMSQFKVKKIYDGIEQ